MHVISETLAYGHVPAFIMGSTLVRPSLNATAEENPASETQCLLRVLAGRTVDLPGGGTLHITCTKTYVIIGKYSKPGERLSLARLIGRAMTPGGARTFIILAMKEKRSTTLGYECGTGLHLLAPSMGTFLRTHGLSNRDLCLWRGNIYDMHMQRLMFWENIAQNTTETPCITSTLTCNLTEDSGEAALTTSDRPTLPTLTAQGRPTVSNIRGILKGSPRQQPVCHRVRFAEPTEGVLM
ncbi:ORF2 [Human alphaherpesvirus 3]|nr:ORF2 [Human alphaherpesvirus 3]